MFQRVAGHQLFLRFDRLSRSLTQSAISHNAGGGCGLRDLCASQPADYWASNWYVQLLGGGPGDNARPAETDDDASRGTTRSSSSSSSRSGSRNGAGGCFGNGPLCGEGALAVAAARLEGYFSAVLLTDSPQAFRVSGLLLQRTLGWRRSVDTDSARRGTRVESRASAELAAFPSAYAQLCRSNSLDLRFYDRARATFHAQALNLLQQAYPPSDKAGAAALLDAAALRDLWGLLGIDASSSNASGKSSRQRINNHGSSGLVDGGASAKSGKGHMASLIGKPLPAKPLLHDSGGHLVTVAARSEPLGQLGAVVQDRSGFGGHTERCKGLGAMGTEACRANLLQHAAVCNQLSYKDGKCFLHDTRAPEFYTDASPGHWTQAAA